MSPYHGRGQATRQTCTIEWIAAVVGYSDISRVRVRLALGLAGARGCTSTPTCNVEAYVEDAADGELAYCHCVVHLRQPIESNVLWLGRTCSRPVHDRVRGQRNIPMSWSLCPKHDGKIAPAPPWAPLWSPTAPRSPAHTPGMPLRGKLVVPLPTLQASLQPAMCTVAEAILGLTLAIVHILGAEHVELQAQDEGSGRLVNFYERVGFTATPKIHDTDHNPNLGEWIHMDGSTAAVAKFAPEAWVTDLVPKNFLPQQWLQQCTTMLWQDRMLARRLPRLEWMVDWPTAANLSAGVVKCIDIAENSEGLLFDVKLKNMRDRGIAHGQAIAMIEENLLWVRQLACGAGDSWLLACSPNDAREGQERIPSESRAVPAMAILGLMASMAMWFGVTVVRLQPFEQGMGRMAHYFLNVGFASTSPEEPAAFKDAAAPFLEATCAQLALRCCPVEWTHQLTRAEDVNRFQQSPHARHLPRGSLAHRHGNGRRTEATIMQQEQLG